MKSIDVMYGGGVVAQCLVDDDDFDKLTGLTVRAFSRGIEKIRPIVVIKRQIIEVGKFLMGTHADDDLVLDHADRNACNNTRANLRWISRSENSRNRHTISESGFRGVRGYQGKWTASLYVGGRVVGCGTYNTPEDAAMAYDAYVRELLGTPDSSTLNFPDVIIEAPVVNRKKADLPRGIWKNARGLYEVELKGVKRMQMKTLEAAMEVQMQCMKDRDDEKIAMRVVDGKIAMFDRARTIIGYAIVDGDMLRGVALKTPSLNRVNGYVYVHVDGRMVALHRYVYTTLLKDGEQLPKCIDHINNDKLDNRLCNLRPSNHSSNNHSKRKRSGTTSTFHGVSWRADQNKWQVSVEKGDVRIRGSFSTETDAAKYYNEKAVLLYGSHAKLNDVANV